MIPRQHAYDAARIAPDTRAKLIEASRSFIAETVFSHPSKLDLIRTANDAGYVVAAHVMLIPEAWPSNACGGAYTTAVTMFPKARPSNGTAVCGDWRRMRSRWPTPQRFTIIHGAKDPELSRN